MTTSTRSDTIFAITTDPYQNIFGYSLVFMQLFDYIAKTYKDHRVVLVSNDGRASETVGNEAFIKVKTSPGSPMIIKSVILGWSFIRHGISMPPGSVVVANSELIELMCASLLKFKYKRVYCFLHDYGSTFRTTPNIYALVRSLFIRRIGNVIVLNDMHGRAILKDIPGVKCFVIPNPVFVEYEAI